MKNANMLQELVARAFKRALHEQNFAVAELMLQALEDMNSECRCSTSLDDALLMIDSPSQWMQPLKRSFH